MFWHRFCGVPPDNISCVILEAPGEEGKVVFGVVRFPAWINALASPIGRRDIGVKQMCLHSLLIGKTLVL
jgi:hypothetical protein